MATGHDDNLSDEQLAELARYADGVLAPGERAEVEARIAASPELAAIVDRQRIAVGALRGTGDTGAPARPRSHVERRRAGGGAAPGPPSRIAIGGAIGAVAALAIVVVLALPGSGGPSVADAAALAVRPPTQSAPAAVPGTPALLRERVDGVPFPNYAKKFGWRPVGVRTDELDGRSATTVFYEKDGRRVAYTIVSGDGIDLPSDTVKTTRGGVAYHTFRAGGHRAVTWERD